MENIDSLTVAVPLTGLEPATHDLEDRCSVHMSYRGIEWA